MKHLALFVLAYSLLAPVQAQAQQLMKTLNDWRVFTHTLNGKKVCYIASVPVKKTGNYSRRDEPFAMVTGKAGGTDEVSIGAGYPLKLQSEVVLTIDGKTYQMFINNERAWAYDQSQDKAMVDAMMRGKQMVARGTSQKGTFSEDTYSLSGFTGAHAEMKKICP